MGIGIFAWNGIANEKTTSGRKTASFRTGARLGKGNGFNDLEWGILCELGVVDERTKVATTVHDVQVLELPHFLCQQHDLPVDIICTPAKTSEPLNSHVFFGGNLSKTKQ